MELNTRASASASASGPERKTAADAKILADLKTLTEKMDLCKSMLNPGAADPKLSMKSEAMLAVIGFLEACAPRMVELVEAAATGILSEEVFAECLGANDRLQKLLSDIETASLTETSASTTAASAPDTSSLIPDFDDLIFGEDEPPPAPSVAGGKTTGEDDDDDDNEDSKMPAAPAPAAAGLKVGDDDDDFDAFFAERTS